MNKPSSFKKKTLDDILAEEDEFGLLEVKPLTATASPDNLVASRLAGINEFYAEHGRCPLPDAKSMNERLLAKRLAAIRKDPTQHEALQPFDPYGLLNVPTGTPEPTPVIEEEEDEDSAERVMSLEDIFADDDDGLLSFDEPDIFTFNHVSHKKKTKPDEIASRQPCAEFHRFSAMFETVKAGLVAREFSTERFRHQLKMEEGDFFILNGIMGYVNQVGEKLPDHKTWNARLHLVFENGTEMHMLFLSLTHGLVRDKTGRKLVLNGQSLRPDNTPIPSGWIYVLSTKSDNPVLNRYKPDLYKIGFTKGTVEERIKYAEKDKTFLEAPVDIVMTAQCFNNVNAHQLEMLIHAFLGKQKLNMVLLARDGKSYRPNEWFNIPLATVQATIEHILDGTIAQYRINNTTGKIVKK